MKKLIVGALGLWVLTLIGCEKNRVTAENSSMASQSSVSSDSLTLKDTTKTGELNDDKAALARGNEYQFHEFIIPKNKRDSALKVFRDTYTKEQQYTILALNRLDQKNIWRADTLLIPETIEENFIKYSPFPTQLNILKDVNKFVVFSYPIQAFGAYENGILKRWGPTSMGKKSAQTKQGLMFSNWKKELATSTVKSTWKLPYNFNIHNTLGIAWHQYNLPGFPASHSCLRLLLDDAKWLYNFADQWILNASGSTVRANGTPVLVFGEYGWGKAKPWKHLTTNPDAARYTVEQMNQQIEPYISKVKEEQEKRAKVLRARSDEKSITDK